MPDAARIGLAAAPVPQRHEQRWPAGLPRAASFLPAASGESGEPPAGLLSPEIGQIGAANPTAPPQAEAAMGNPSPSPAAPGLPMPDVAAEIGQPTSESRSDLAAPPLAAEMRDQPLRVAEAPALYRPAAAEPHRQIADAIVRARDGQIELILNPVELGRVTVLMGAEGNPGHLALFVERPETLELIRRHGDQLLRELRDGGMPDPSLDLLQQDSRDHPGDRGPRRGSDRDSRQDRPADPVREPAARAISLSRLDIRL